MDILSESELVNAYLARRDHARMVQIGANEGKFEYAKEDGKDFVFEFLRQNTGWAALLIEPIPEIFDRLKANYANHDNELHYLNCAITMAFENRVLRITGKDGKSSSLQEGGIEADQPLPETDIVVPCLPYSLACRLQNWTAIDFVKIDAEGYDETIVSGILSDADRHLRPGILMWEQLGPEKLDCSARLEAEGYRVFRTGLNKRGDYMDRLAIRRSLL